jgi:hypothetical protein
MAEIIITGMKIEKNQIVITEAKQVDDDGNPTRKVSINEHFAIALKGSVIELNLDHLKKDF